MSKTVTTTALTYCSLLAKSKDDLARLVLTLCDQNQHLRDVIKAVNECDLKHDEKGHAYLKVPARSIFDLGALIGTIAREDTADFKAGRGG